MGRIPARSESEWYGFGTIQAGEYFGVMTNSRYQADGTVPGFIYCPARGGGGYNIKGMGPARRLAMLGYPVICGDFGCTPTKIGLADGTHKWGNDASQTILNTYRTYLQGTLGAKPGKIGLLYGSGGASIAYAWAYANPNSVYCIAGAIGSVDIEDIRVNNRLSAQAEIEAAYTDNAGWQSARSTHNPVQVADDIASIPQLDYYSTDDPACVPSTHTALASAAGNGLTQVSLGAVGHSLGNLIARDSAETIDFVSWVESYLV